MAATRAHERTSAQVARTLRQRIPRQAQSARPGPPSGDLINAVIRYADLMKPVGANCTLLGLSIRRATDPVIAGPLGREGPRLGDIAVLWDDEEDQIVRVLDAAAGDTVSLERSMKPMVEPGLELTPAALAYLDASRGRTH